MQRPQVTSPCDTGMTAQVRERIDVREDRHLDTAEIQALRATEQSSRVEMQVVSLFGEGNEVPMEIDDQTAVIERDLRHTQVREATPVVVAVSKARLDQDSGGLGQVTRRDQQIQVVIAACDRAMGPQTGHRRTFHDRPGDPPAVESTRNRGERSRGLQMSETCPPPTQLEILGNLYAVALERQCQRNGNPVASCGLDELGNPSGIDPRRAIGETRFRIGDDPRQHLDRRSPGAIPCWPTPLLGAVQTDRLASHHAADGIGASPHPGTAVPLDRADQTRGPLNGFVGRGGSIATMNASQTSFAHANGLTWDRVDDRIVVLDADGSSMITLNPVASLLWPALQPRATAEALVHMLQRNFEGVPQDQLQRDVDTFLEELLGEGLIDVSETTSETI